MLSGALCASPYGFHAPAAAAAARAASSFCFSASLLSLLLGALGLLGGEIGLRLSAVCACCLI